MTVRKLFFTQDDIGISDEYAETPETLQVSFDQEVILKSEKLLHENPWLYSVKITDTVDYELPKGFECKQGMGKLEVSCYGVYFSFFNEWSDVSYSVEIPERPAE